MKEGYQQYIFIHLKERVKEAIQYQKNSMVSKC